MRQLLCAAIGAVILVAILTPAASVAEAPVRTDAYGDPLPAGAVMRIGTVRWRHEGSLQTLQFSDDGMVVLAGDTEGAWLWEAASGKLIRIFRGDWSHSGAALSGDGKLVAAGGGRGTIKLWDRETGKEVRTIETDPGLLELALAPDGKTLASGNIKETRFWDVKSGQLLLAVAARNVITNQIVFSSDGKQMACCTAGGTISLWDMQTRRQVGRVDCGSDSVETEVPRASFTPDGLTLVVVGSRLETVAGKDYCFPVVRMVELATRKDRIEIQPDSMKRSDFQVSIAISPDGRTLAVFSAHCGVSLWDLGSGEQLGVWPVPDVTSYHTRCVAFSPDGKTLAAAEGQVLRLWELATGKPLHAYSDAPENFLRKIALSSDGKKAVTVASDHAVQLWDARTGRPEKLLDHINTGKHGLAISPDEKRVACCGYDGWVTCYDLRSHERLWKVRLAGFGASGPAFSPDSRMIACAHGDRNRKVPPGGKLELGDCVVFWDATSGEEMWRIPADLGGSGGLVGFSSEGATIYVHPWIGGEVNRFDVATGKKLGKVLFRGLLTALVPEHKLLLTGAGKGTVVFTDLEKGTDVCRKDVGPGYACYVAISPDGKYVATGPEEYSLRPPDPRRKLMVREFATGKVVRSLSLPDDVRIINLQFSPDGKQLVTGTMNCTILFWDWPNWPEQHAEK